MIDICFDCKYYVDGMCTQYDIAVSPTDGCSNGEKGDVSALLNKQAANSNFAKAAKLTE